MPSGPVDGESDGDAISFILQQQDQEEFQFQRQSILTGEVVGLRSLRWRGVQCPDRSPPSPTLPTSA